MPSGEKSTWRWGARVGRDVSHYLCQFSRSYRALGSHFPRGFASKELNLNQVFCLLTEFSECRSEKYNNEEVV